MALAEKIRALFLAGVANAALSGCEDSQYHYNGKIGDEHVVFWEEKFGLTHYLKVRRPDGILITYVDDMRCESGIDELIIRSPDGKVLKYDCHDLWSKPIFAKAEKQFEAYLRGIVAAKVEEGVNAVQPEGKKQARGAE